MSDHVQMPSDAFQRVVDLAVARDAHAWPWNYRDVDQSAERIALATWNLTPEKNRSGALTVAPATVEAEVAFLRERWRRLAPTSGPSNTDARIEATFGAAKVEGWSLAERLEARAAWEAHQRCPDNHAEAFRAYLRAMYPESGAERAAGTKNPTKGFRDLVARLGLGPWLVAKRTE